MVAHYTNWLLKKKKTKQTKDQKWSVLNSLDLGMLKTNREEGVHIRGKSHPCSSIYLSQ